MKFVPAYSKFIVTICSVFFLYALSIAQTDSNKNTENISIGNQGTSLSGTWIQNDKQNVEIVISEKSTDKFHLDFKGNNYLFTYLEKEKFWHCANIKFKDYEQAELRVIGKNILKITFYGLFNDGRRYYLHRTFTKLLNDDIKKTEEIFKKNNIIFRYTYNEGIIGKDYIPEITRQYNAGRKFKINGIEIQEKDYKTYTESGGYSKKIKGFTAVYQFINKSEYLYVVAVNTYGTSKIPNTVRTGILYSGYKVKNEFNTLQSSSSFILKPMDVWKDQIAIGVEIPRDFGIILEDIYIINQDWIDGLDKALNADNLDIVKQYLKDERAKGWYDKIIKNKERITKMNIESFNQRYKKQVLAFIKMEDPKLFDPDFDSRISISLKNNSSKKIQVTYENMLGEFVETLEPYGFFEKTQTIKGFKSNELFMNIKRVDQK